MSEFEITLKKIKEFIDLGGGASQWFRKAYVSWYRGDHRLIDLQGAESLDANNLELFIEMIQLRRAPNWDDWALYELERYIRDRWKADFELPHL